MADDTVAEFTAEDGLRIADTVRAWEKRPQNVALQPNYGGKFAAYGVIHGVVTTAIPSGTLGSESTTGQATLYAWNGTAHGAIGTGPFRIVNAIPIPAAVAIGKQIKAAWGGGDFHLVACECP